MDWKELSKKSEILKERSISINSPCSSDYEEKIMDIERRLSEVRIRQNRAFKEAEKVYFL